MATSGDVAGEGGAWVAELKLLFVSAQVVISGSWDPAPRRVPCSVWSLPESLSPSSSVPLYCSLCPSNKKSSTLSLLGFSVRLPAVAVPIVREIGDFPQI